MPITSVEPQEGGGYEDQGRKWRKKKQLDEEGKEERIEEELELEVEVGLRSQSCSCHGTHVAV